jgi:hypothetical protein
MIKSGLRFGYSLFYIIEGILFIFITYMFITMLPSIIRQYQNEGDITGLLIIGFGLLVAIFMIIYCIIGLLFNKISLNNEGITIENPETKLTIPWNNVDNIVKNEQAIIGKRIDLLLREKVQLYNRGFYKYILFWYKTNVIPVSQYKKEIPNEIIKKIQK